MSKTIKVKVFKNETFVKNNEGDFAEGGETLVLPKAIATNLIARGKVYDLSDSDAVKAAKAREKADEKQAEELAKRKEAEEAARLAALEANK